MSWETTPVGWLGFYHVCVAIEPCEYDLDNLHLHAGTLIATPGMSVFWSNYGGFPASYYVRDEEVAVWSVVKDVLLRKTDKVVLAGSDGVGKSLLVAQMALYIANTMKRDVLVIRQLKLPRISNVAVYFSRWGSTYVAHNVADLHGLILAQPVERCVLVDGYSQQEMNHHGLSTPTLVATSHPYDLQGDDSATMVVLSAWTLPQLLCYAQSTNWEMPIDPLETEPPQLPIDTTTPLQTLVKQHHFFSGGSLRAFCQPRSKIRMAITSAIWSGQQSRLRRVYIANGDNPGNCTWRHIVDSGLALKHLMLEDRMTMREHVVSLTNAVSMCDPELIATTYEQLFHHLICASIETTRTPWKTSNRLASRLESCVTSVVISGLDEASCLEQLQSLRAGVYWMPECPGCVPIQAIMPCKIWRGRSSIEALAMVYVTMHTQKQWEQHHVDQIKQAIQANSYLRTRVLVTVVATPTDPFSWRWIGEPQPATANVFISQYDPLGLCHP